MKEKALGRPSTWAHILATLRRRGYVVQRGPFLVPTRWGREIHERLCREYPQYVSEAFTRALEEKLLAVERGERPPKVFLRELRQALPLEPTAPDRPGGGRPRP